jgi:hypothetical protein
LRASKSMSAWTAEDNIADKPISKVVKMRLIDEPQLSLNRGGVGGPC